MRNIGSWYVSQAKLSQAKYLSIFDIQNKYNSSRSSFRQHRGRGRGSRGGYSGYRPPNQRPFLPSPTEGWGNTWPTETPSIPVPAPLEPASTQAMTSHSTSVPDSYHSQGYAPPPKSPHTPSHTYPHPITSSSSHSRPHPHAYAHTAVPTSPVIATTPSFSQSKHRQGAHSQLYEHERARAHPRDHPQPPTPPRSYERRGAPTLASQAADDGYRQGAHPQVHEHGQSRTRSHPQSPPFPRSHEWRPAPAPAPAPQAQAADDGNHDADSYTVHTPEPSDEPVGWTSTPTSDSVGGLQRRHSQGQGQCRHSSPSRSYVGHNRHGDEMRGGRR